MSWLLSTQGVELGPRPEATRGQPLDKWEDFLDPEGRVKNPEKVKELVFRGVGGSYLPLQTKLSEFNAVLFLAGHHSIFKERSVEVSFGFLSMDQHNKGERGHPSSQNVSTFLQAFSQSSLMSFQQLLSNLVYFCETASFFCRDEYFRMKVQWKSVSEEQEMRNSLLRGYRSLIGEDFCRTAHRFAQIRSRR